MKGAVLSGPRRPVFLGKFFTLESKRLCFWLVYGTAYSSRRFPGEMHNFTLPFLRPHQVLLDVFLFGFTGGLGKGFYQAKLGFLKPFLSPFYKAQ